MIKVRRPVLLDEHLGDRETLYPKKGSLKLKMTGVNEASLALDDHAEGIPMHAWVKIYNHLGFAGIYRRIGSDSSVTVEKSYSLRHGIDILQDSVWEAETSFSGTVAGFMEALLAQQTSLIQGPGDNAPRKPWVLGSCADTSAYQKDINYDNLMDLMNGLVDESSDFYFVYDQTGWPWTVSLVRKSSAVSSEFRLNRNLEKCKIKDNDTELCTRLILNLNAMENDTGLADDTGITVKQNTSIFRIYNNTAAQAIYGIISKKADIDVTDSLPSGPFPQADAWAADFLARRAAPELQIQIDGYVLKGITGDDWDESRIGTVCRVSLNEYPAPIDERVVAVTYPDLYDAPDRVSVSLANALPTFTRSMRSTQQSVSHMESASRGTSRQVADLNQHFEITDAAGKILKQAGMKLDASGMLVYADDNENMVGSRFNVQADKIGMVVGTKNGQNYIKAGEIALSINNQGESKILLSADVIDIDGILTSLTTVLDTLIPDSGQISIMGDLSVGGHLYAGSLDAEYGPLTLGNSTLDLGAYDASWKSKTVVTSATCTFPGISRSAEVTVGNVKGRLITGYTSGSFSALTDTIYYLGR